MIMITVIIILMVLTNLAIILSTSHGTVLG